MSLQNILTVVIVVTACLALLAVVLAPFFNVTMPGEVQTFVFGLITIAIGGGAGVSLWRTAEQRGEVKAAASLTVAQALEISRRAEKK